MKPGGVMPSGRQVPFVLLFEVHGGFEGSLTIG